jgi:hypothetical protein
MFPASSESMAVPLEGLGLGRDCLGEEVFGVALPLAPFPFPPLLGSAGALPRPEAISSSSLGR